MKSITTTVSGLASSLFLSVGFVSIAQKFDPVSQDRCEHCVDATGASLTIVCSFPAKRRV